MATETGEEETISNIANFLEETKQNGNDLKEDVKAKVTTEREENQKEMNMSNKDSTVSEKIPRKGTHKLPVSLVSSKPTVSKKTSLASKPVRNMSSLSGISINKVSTSNSSPSEAKISPTTGSSSLTTGDSSKMRKMSSLSGISFNKISKNSSVETKTFLSSSVAGDESRHQLPDSSNNQKKTQVPGNITLSNVATEQSDSEDEDPSRAPTNPVISRNLPPSVQISSKPTSKPQLPGNITLSNVTPKPKQPGSEAEPSSTPASGLHRNLPASVQLSSQPVTKTQLPGNISLSSVSSKPKQPNSDVQPASAPVPRVLPRILPPSVQISSTPSSPSIVSAVPLPPNKSSVVPSDSIYHGSVPVAELSHLTEKLGSDPALSEKVLQFISQDCIRNLCDAVMTLQISGLTTCSDVETLSLYKTVVNITSLADKLETINTEEFLPLTNLSGKVSFCYDLLKLVDKEPNLRGHLSSSVGGEDFSKYELVVGRHFTDGLLFIKYDVEEILKLYHKLRNLALKYVLTKLRNVYTKMKPMFSSMNVPDAEFKSCLSRLSNLVSADWLEEVKISEETGYDFNFLITIMKYVKKAKESPSQPKPPQLSSSAASIDPSPVSIKPVTPSAPEVPVSNQKQKVT